jgi:Ca2+-binding RTX toxin-like protein
MPLFGTIYNDYITGTAGDDTIIGDYGDDILVGGSGNDTIFGDWGNDQLYGDNGTDYLYGGDQNDYLWGGYGADRMYGGSGNDYIVSGVGSSWDGLVDTIDGGTGVDVWEVDFSAYGSAINIAVPASAATVVTTPYAVFEGIEAFVMGGTNYNDLIYGGGYRDILYGWYGDDGLTGGGGDDILYGEYGSDALLGDAGIDQLYGGDGVDYLIGGDGGDYIDGEAGDDVLQGINGADDMYGRGGNDTYLYYNLSDSTVSASGRDEIFDFASGDLIDLSMLDADSATGGNQAFAFAGSAAANSIWAVTAGGITSIFADVDGNAVADFQIDLRNAYAVGVSDFIL